MQSRPPRIFGIALTDSAITKDGEHLVEADLGTPTTIRAGRTQWMIDHLCDAVAEGQPKSRVLGHTVAFSLRHLKPRVLEALKQRGLTIDRVTKDSIEVEGSVILFSSTSLPAEYHRGLRGWGDFVDHHADNDEFMHDHTQRISWEGEWGGVREPAVEQETENKKER